MTPNVARAHSYLHAKFPELADFGQYSCRNIAGTGSWSQHAWSNADDFKTGPYGSAYSSSYALQQKVIAHLLEWVPTTGGPMRVYQALGMRTILAWRRSILTGSTVAGHTDHIHADYWPKGIWTPPCGGGSRRVQYPNGSIGSSFILYPNVTILTPEEEKQMAKITYRGVRNVPATSDGKPQPWAKETVDHAIKSGRWITTDEVTENFEETLTVGRYMTFEMRRDKRTA